MSELLARCLLLKATLSELQGKTGRRHYISDVDDWPAWGPTDPWQWWRPWTADAPHPWAVYVLAKCEPLREAVLAIRGVRTELAASAWTSPILERSFHTYLEQEVLGRPWLAEIEDGYTVGSGPDAEWSPSGVLSLVTLPASPVRLEGLVTIARDAVLAGVLVGSPGGSAGENRVGRRLPKRVGRTQLAATRDGPSIITLIRTMKDERATWREIGDALDMKFPHLKPFSANRARQILERENARLRAGE